MNTSIKKLISLVLAVVLVVGSLPLQTTANDDLINNAPTAAKEEVLKEPSIVGEIADKREKNVKHFLKDDMTYEAAVYPYAVHYQENGAWVDIDNTLESITDEDEEQVLANKKNEYKIKIAKKADSKKLISIKKDSFEVAWGIEGTKTSSIEVLPDNSIKVEGLSENDKRRQLTKLTSEVQFKEIFDNTDLQYVIMPEQVKENIIVNKPTEINEYNFNIQVKNLVPQINEDNSLTFYNVENNLDEVFKIQTPVMFDANQKYSNAIKMDLKETEKGYTLTFIPSKDWMNDAERVYPVTIDPWVTTVSGAAYVKDNYVRPYYPYTSMHDYDYNCREILDVASSSETQRSYIRFTQLPQLKTGEMIVGAALSLYLSYSPYISSRPYSQVAVHKVTSDWQDYSITWNNQPTYDAKIDDYELISGYENSGGAYRQHTWDITNMTKDWYSSEINYGLMLEHINYGHCRFASAHTTYSPQLVINYVSNIGLENFWTYHSQSIGRAGTGYINDYTGNVVFTHEDISSNGNRMPISISHVFNSHNSNSDMGYGLGWMLNLSQRIFTKDIGNEKYMVYIDGDGTEHYFKYNTATGTYDKDESGLNLTLTGSNTITDKDKTQFVFNGPSGYLSSIIDRNGNTIKLGYEGSSLKTVTDPANRVITLSYTDGKLSGIRDFYGRETFYEYTAGKLTKITYSDTKYSSYDYTLYGSNNMLSSATNHDGYKISYEYNSTDPYRVKKVCEQNIDGTLGQEINISYSNNLTTFTDINGKKLSYTFNNYGNTISIMDNLGNAQYYKYLRGGTASNKLSQSSKLQKTIVNYLQNHNAEANTAWMSEAVDGSTGTCSYDSTEKYLGSRSLKIDKSNAAGRQGYSQEITLTKGKTYTLSGYIKTSSISSSANKGAALYITYQDDLGVWKTVNSKYINGTNDWQRAELAFTLPSNAASNIVQVKLGIAEETGTMYVDAIQLEDGEIANRYNLIENGDFSYKSSGTYQWPDSWYPSWQYNNSSYILWPEGDQSFPNSLSRNCFKFTGMIDQAQQIYQTIKHTGKRGDVFSIGGWSKGESVPTGSDNNSIYEIQVVLKDAYNGVQKTIISFNSQSRDWHYVSDRVVANMDYVEITVRIVYDYNANVSYFDGIQLYKEEFGSSYQYDSNGNVISATDLASQNSQFQYNSNNDISAMISPKGNRFSYSYDDKKNLLNATTAENAVYSFTYDSYGNPLTAKLGNGTLFINSSAKYTTSGNYPETITDPSGNTLTYHYDETRGTLKDLTDPRNKTTSYSYDAMDRLTDVYKTADAQEVRNTYTYENDKLKRITHNGFDYEYNYDSLGNTTSIMAANQALVTNTYEPRTSKLLESSYQNGQTIGFDYDSLDRVIAKKVNGVTKYKYAYNGDSNVGYIEDLINNVNYRYVFDIAERLTRIQESNGNSTSFSYDLDNNLSTLTEKVNGSNFSTSYTYDKDNKPKRTTIHNNAYSEYSYDAISRITGIGVNTGAFTYNTTFSYLPGVNGSTTTKLDTINNNGKAITYTYDENGNIVTATENGNVVKYYYNELNEITREDNQALNKTITYSYDAGGNIREKIEYPYTTDTPGSPIKTYTYTYDTVWKDKLESYDGNAITYDAIGNPLSYNGYTYTWEMGRQLAAINGNGSNITYKYNDAGIRTEKTVNGITTKYHLSGDKVTYETNGTDNIYYTYDPNDKLISMNLNGIEYYYIRNGQGDIIGLFDSTGTQAVSYNYDTWGKLVSIDGALKDTLGMKNPYRYRGYRYDTETGLYYLQSRYYNPEWGRFINADDINTVTATLTDLTDKNLFAYCDNNPVMRADDGGCFWHVVAAAAAGALISGAMDVVTQVATTGRWDWKQTAIAAGTGAISGATAMIPGGALLTTSLSVGINAALGAGAYAATEAVNGRKVTTGGLIASTASGGIGGFVGAKVRVKSTSALGKSAKATIDKGTKKVMNGIANSAKGTIKRGYQYWDDGYSMLNRYGWRTGVNSGIGSATGIFAYQPYAGATGGHGW